PPADVSAVEAIPCHVDRGPATSGEIPLLFVDQRPESARELGLAKDTPHGRYSALGSLKINACATRITPDVLELGPQVVRQEFVPGETVSERDCRGQDVGKRERAELRKHDAERVDDRWDSAGGGTVRWNALSAEDGGRRSGGRHSLPANDHDLFAV